MKKLISISLLSACFAIPALAFNPQPDPPGDARVMQTNTAGCSNNMHMSAGGSNKSNKIIVQGGAPVANNGAMNNHMAMNNHTAMNGHMTAGQAVHCDGSVKPAAH